MQGTELELVERVELDLGPVPADDNPVQMDW